MHLTIIQVPYHLGIPRVGIGRGPGRLVLGGLTDSLAGPGVSTSVESIEQLDTPAGEMDLVQRLAARLATRVHAATDAGQLPVVLAGDCNSALGVLGGLAAAGCNAPGLLWFDAHGDVNTPETSPSGFIDGMSLAVATGRCHDDLRAASGLRQPLPEDRVVLAGVRDLDPGEEQYLVRSPIRVLRAAELRAAGPAALVPALDALARRTTDLYVHVDLDALDPAEAPATSYSTPFGLTTDTLVSALRLATARFRVRALAVTNYDPDADADDRTLAAAMRVVHAVARGVERRAPLT